jgi:hypothetical protein
VAASNCNELDCAFPELPRMSAISVEQKRDTALFHFAGFEDAVDYRVFDPGSPEGVSVTPQGRVVVENALYRCAGNRQFEARPRLNSLEGDVGGFYTRTEQESVLGYVYLEPGEGRLAVRRLADSRADADDSFDAPAIAASRAARYVVEGPRAEALLALGYRDDGIAFYVPNTSESVHPIYFWQSGPRSDLDGRRLSVYFQDGAERQAFEGSALTEFFEEELGVLDEAGADTVPLRRIFYEGGNDHDVLSAGGAEYERLLRQGNTPVFTLAWPALREPTTLVVEALDAGCPYAGRLVPERASRFGEAAVTTLNEAALSTGEVFVNGQHEPQSRPSAIARSFVAVAPEPRGDFDLADDFDDEDWDSLSPATDDDGQRRENVPWLVETAGLQSYAVGAMLGQLWLDASDDGAAGLLTVTRKVDFELTGSSYLHVTVQTNLPATARRYPFLALRGQEQTLVVRAVGLAQAPFAETVVLDLQVCSGTTWQPNVGCPRTELAGRRLGDPSDPNPWAPVPVPGELAGFDWPVTLDLYASTQRAYLFLDGRPAGCGSFPIGALREGVVQVSFGTVVNESREDEATADETSPHQYLREYSAGRDSRRFDQLGVSRSEEPNWQADLFPCGGEWVQ